MEVSNLESKKMEKLITWLLLHLIIGFLLLLPDVFNTSGGGKFYDMLLFLFLRSIDLRDLF